MKLLGLSPIIVCTAILAIIPPGLAAGAGSGHDAATSSATPSVTPSAAPSAAPSVTSSASSVSAKSHEPDVPFLESFPQLKDYIYQEPASKFYLGLGGSPLGILKDREMFTVNFFQFHYFGESWDFEIFNASFGFTHAQNATFQANYFTFRTTPKYRISEIFSIGPILGFEFVSFPNIGSHLNNGQLETKEEPFSSRGAIAGVMLTETFKMGQKNLLQISQLAFKETYSTTQSPDHWHYIYDESSLNADPTLIGAGLLVMLEVSYLY
ncbi:MAG: hypothetical protein C5B49_06405 [Bdellovibrio sp.]|nr:MAG: hypothetical protein C5B49_06405 [Bdellovibrio sp.]